MRDIGALLIKCPMVYDNQIRKHQIHIGKHVYTLVRRIQMPEVNLARYSIQSKIETGRGVLCGVYIYRYDELYNALARGRRYSRLS